MRNFLMFTLVSSSLLAQSREITPSPLLAQKPGAPRVLLIEEDEKKKQIADSNEEKKEEETPS